MFETILVPTDGSRHAEAALVDAIDLAAEQRATLHVLSVADSGLLGGLRLPGEAARPSDAIRERSEGFVDEALERAGEAGIDSDGTVRMGPPAEEILAYADDVGADLIVMGSRGRGGLHRMAVGSVADHVIRFGDVRVMIVDADTDRS